MRMYSDFTWKGTKLYLGSEDTGFSVEYDGDYGFDHFYRIRWPDGVLSQDVYNLTRTKDNAVNTAMSIENRDTEIDARDGAT